MKLVLTKEEKEAIFAMPAYKSSDHYFSFKHKDGTHSLIVIVTFKKKLDFSLEIEDITKDEHKNEIITEEDQ